MDQDLSARPSYDDLQTVRQAISNLVESQKVLGYKTLSMETQIKTEVKKALGVRRAGRIVMMAINEVLGDFIKGRSLLRTGEDTFTILDSVEEAQPPVDPRSPADIFYEELKKIVDARRLNDVFFFNFEVAQAARKAGLGLGDEVKDRQAMSSRIANAPDRYLITVNGDHLLVERIKKLAEAEYKRVESSDPLAKK
jgi:hypothetical protein